MKDIMRRLKGFYESRRNAKVTKEDEVKNMKRKLAVKASSRTYVSNKVL